MTNMNAGKLHDVLMKKGAELIVETLEGLEKGILSREEQMDLAGLEIKHAPKIFKSDCQINWSDNRSLIHDKIRGLSPYPGAWSILYNKVKKTKVQFKFFSSSLLSEETSQNKVNLKLGAHGILFPCKDGFLEVSELQMEGKRRMHYKEFLAGNALEDFEIFKA